MNDNIRTTVVTAGDRAFAWGAFLLVASMRRNGMRHPVVVGAMNWTEEMKDALVAAWEHPVRKGAHFSEYALMAILLYLIWAPWIKRGFGLYLMIILWVFASAGLDELHQTFVAQRDGNFIDVMIDTAGAAFGIAVLLFIVSHVKRCAPVNV